MPKLPNLFEQFIENQKRNVDSIHYQPLGQGINVLTEEEVKRIKQREAQKKYKENMTDEQKAKRKAYHQQYYLDHREKLLERNKQYQENKRKERWLGTRKHFSLNKTGLTELQQYIYDQMVEYYKVHNKLPRGTQLAKELWMWDASVYQVINILIKKGFIFKWELGKLYLSNLVDEPKEEPTVEVTTKPVEITTAESKEPVSRTFPWEMVYVNEKEYDKLVKDKERLAKLVKELREQIDSLQNDLADERDRHHKLEVDRDRLEELERLTCRQAKERHEIELAVKTLFKHFF